MAQLLLAVALCQILTYAISPLPKNHLHDDHSRWAPVPQLLLTIWASRPTAADADFFLTVVPAALGSRVRALQVAWLRAGAWQLRGSRGFHGLACERPLAAFFPRAQGDFL